VSGFRLVDLLTRKQNMTSMAMAKQHGKHGNKASMAEAKHKMMVGDDMYLNHACASIRLTLAAAAPEPPTTAEVL
jgi:hypothetical protein